MKDQDEDAAREQGLEDHPDHPEQGLAVAQGDVAGAETVEDLAGLPQFAAPWGTANFFGGVMTMAGMGPQSCE